MFTLHLIGALSFAAHSYAAVITVTAGKPCSSATATNIPTPSSTYNFSPLGTCGPDVGFSCYGAPGGSCCSSYGFCGNTTDYCGSGCQGGFGDCDAVVSSSSAIPETASQSSSSATLSVALETAPAYVVPASSSSEVEAAPVYTPAPSPSSVLVSNSAAAY